VRGLRRALKWIQDHRPEEIAEVIPATYRGDNREVYLEALRNCYGMYSPDGLMTLGGPEIVYKVLSASVPELRTANFDLRQTWTNEFIERP
jgi:NitT/TauT family transport system substrate-binding protein